MPTYNPTVFVDGPTGNTPISAAELNKLGAGVAAQAQPNAVVLNPGDSTSVYADGTLIFQKVPAAGGNYVFPGVGSVNGKTGSVVLAASDVGAAAINDAAPSTATTYSSSQIETKLSAAGTGGGTTNPRGIWFDTFFAPGGTTDQKIAAMNTYVHGLGATGSRQDIVFAAKQYTFSTPIQLWSGLQITGEKEAPAREFSTSTILNFTGGAGTALFTYGGTNVQGYPSSGAPRDMFIGNMQLQAGASADIFQQVPNYVAAQVIWSSEFRNLGWLNARTGFVGYGDDLAFTGIHHFQSIQGYAMDVAGSENTFFVGGGQSVGGNSVDNALPLFRIRSGKSELGGTFMSTMRKSSYALDINGVFDLTVRGFRADNQDTDPGYGCAIVVRGNCDGVYFDDISVKGYMTKPASSLAGLGKALIQVQSGALGVVFNHISGQYDTAGVTSALPSVPLLYAEAGVGAGQVTVMSVTANHTAGAKPIIQQATSGQIVGPVIGGTLTTGAL